MEVKRDILIVEDNKKVINLLANHLEKDFMIYKARSISEAKNYLKKKHIDAVCLDLVLPDGNGFDLSKDIKETYPQIKILILTKYTTLDVRLKSFGVGADEYLAKPFFPEELTARLKRFFSDTKQEQRIIHYKGLQLETEINKISFNRIGVILSNTECLIMEFLMKTPTIKSPESIIKYLSTKLNKPINKKSLVVEISRLRAKFERNTGMRILKTRYAKGYYIGF